MSSRRTPRVGGGLTSARSSRATPRSVRETPRDMSISKSSRRTSPRWMAGNQLDKRRGLSHHETLQAIAKDALSSSSSTNTIRSTHPNSRRTTPRWVGGNRIDKQSPALTLNSGGFPLQKVLTQANVATNNNNDANDISEGTTYGKTYDTGRNSVQSTSRSDAMRIFIGIDPKDATVKHTSYDPLAWYAPAISMVAPGKSVYVDHNEAARLKKHQTRSDLLRTHKRATLPHPTYDIDGDGIVNQSDLKVAREVDPKGLGVLDAVGTKNGKRRLARQYLNHNQKERWFKHIAPDIAAMPLDVAVEHIANVPNFSRTLAALRLKARPGNGTGGRGSRAALVEVDHGWASSVQERGPKIPTMVPATSRTSKRRQKIQKNNTNESEKRMESDNENESKGPEQNSLRFRPAKSQSELFKTRKMQAIRHNQDRFEVGDTPQDNRRVDLITVPKAWTRCENTSKPFLRHMYENQKAAKSSSQIIVTARAAAAERAMPLEH